MASFSIPLGAVMSVETFQSLLCIAIGFAVGGLLASAYQGLAHRPLSFGAVRDGFMVTLVATPLLVFAAPFIILRNAVRRRAVDRWEFHMVMAATIVASMWSLACGSVVVMAAAKIGLI